MPFQQPLVPPVLHVADPLDLPLRNHGEGGLCQVTRARVTASRGDGWELEVTGSTGETLFVEVTAAGEGIVRVRLAPDRDTRGGAAAATTLVRPRADVAARTWEGQGVLRLETGQLVAELELDPWRLRFIDSAGRHLTAQNGVESDISQRLRILPFGRSTVDGEIVAYHETFTAQADEHFFGFGEKFTGFDKRGQRITSWNYDAFSAESERAYKNIPFYLSSRGYGVLVDTGSPAEFDVCHSTHSCVQITVPDRLLDYYVIAGPDPARIIQGYHQLTGPPAVPPAWALGTWMSTGYAAEDGGGVELAESQDRVLQLARTVREHGIPCDVIHIDTQWQRFDHWSDQQWDTERFPAPEAMLKELADLRFRVCMWINPYVSHLSPVFREAEAEGFLMRHADGSTYVADSWHGDQPACGIVDFTHPGAVRWFQGQLRALLHSGVTVFKSDFGEGVPVDAHAANGMTGEELHNVYTLLFNDVVADVTEEVHGHRVVWARSSFTGGQRHCGQWSGDTNATFTSTASVLRGGLSYALSGVPFWTHDIGGFTGRPSTELYVRSAQFGALCPLTRFHGTSSRLPWDFGEEAEAAVRDALKLRYRLMPYLLTAALDAGDTGYPVMRPLLVDAFDDPSTWSADLAYLLGPDLLVAPVVNPVDTTHPVYLPGGDWIDFWTGETHTGGRYIKAGTPLSRIPLFVRAGALIPVAEPGGTVAETLTTDLSLLHWGTGAGHCRLRDHDGVTRVRAVRRGGRVDIETTGPAPVRSVAFPHVTGVTPPDEVVVNGEEFALTVVDGVPTAFGRTG
jgi:alpha-D-xyloside xylohydrolase